MPNAATVDLDTSQLPADHLLWPEFHNGIAAALRLAPPRCGHSVRIRVRVRVRVRG